MKCGYTVGLQPTPTSKLPQVRNHMTRSDTRPRTSPGRRFSSRGASWLAVLVGGVFLVGSGPALAKKKKVSDDEPAAQATDEEKTKEATPAAQAGDMEKPKRIIEKDQDA